MTTVVQHEVEVILLRQVASYLTFPVFLVDPDGTLLYYNEPAEVLLGYRYEETGAMALEEWGSKWTPTDDAGAVLVPEELPLAVAVRQRRPAHGPMWITGSDGVRRRIVVTALPIIGQGNRQLGSMAVFWEEGE